ncbi:MarC family protein [uncultured Litoreibacter sp.]|uniref:MarC family protein n=1 Tax=uncultured Litoreibacter sp. TaxID=1392394 RepID=UPI002623D05A|nr:MarC family protein [uncultured Litoreibacter sp.]
MELSVAVTAFVTLFVIIDPIGLAPLFVAMTAGTTFQNRLRIGIRSCLVAAFLLTAFGLAGEALLEFVGISMAAFRISGGVLLFITALDMLFERRTQRREDQAEGPLEDDDPSVFPLAMPLIAGPGSLATMILLTGAPGADWSYVAAVHGVMLVVLAIVFAFFLMAGAMERIIGDTGIKVTTRLMGMLLAALSVQFILDGLREFGVVAGS